MNQREEKKQGSCHPWGDKDRQGVCHVHYKTFSLSEKAQKPRVLILSLSLS